LVKDFIWHALQGEKGQRDVNDPMSNLALDSIRIALFERHTTYGD
jgi:hypothetical protein